MTVSSAPLTTAFAAAIVKSDPSRNADAMAAARTAIIDFSPARLPARKTGRPRFWQKASAPICRVMPSSSVPAAAPIR